DFFLLAPDFDGPTRYRAYAEFTTKFGQQPRPQHEILRFIEAFEDALKDNPKYADALARGELQPIEATLIENAMSTWETFMLGQGYRLSDLKLTRLDARYNWREVFQTVIRRDLKRQAASRVDDAAVPVTL
ncbi:MAG: GH3 auxin-responsive promoter family protein, partial [Bdellovibrionales bacterium]|nr:GH3 auxin-responsive promoter family protein [Bdellovibrionales bacterium]